ncbi:MAG: hypothetical protein HY321_19780 [Armatimonadetes bacterium]|nr:hypothetical protein [Armatimonadota bacterium]
MSEPMKAHILSDPSDPVVGQPPARWAVAELRRALASRGVSVTVGGRSDTIPAGARCVVAAGRDSILAREVLSGAGQSVPDAPEALALVPGTLAGREVALACGSDARGLMYALLELADRVAHAEEPLRALEIGRPVVERPANAIRSVARLFTCEAWDKPWYYDREFWGRYLTMLAAQRFNRFSLTLGLGYNFPRHIRDAYFFFAYPFLLSVPGYDVRVPGLPDAEREKNLETLRFIGEEATRRGLHFQLALWTHACEWLESPDANYVVEGLTPETHAPYCRDALRALLETCPDIAGVTFRVHGESGVPERSFDFWATVFDGIAQCGRPVEIDMHAKGLDGQMIDVAVATGLPVNISAKYWAEHMGLPYQQASIRPGEMPPALDPGGARTLSETARTEFRGLIGRGLNADNFMPFSGGLRRFMRYSFGDLLTEGRPYGIFFRIWPGTQRLLLWGDPAMAAGYGRSASFCGCLGVEICEPFSFRGRMGSGLPGERDAYADPFLQTPGGDWEKHRYTYRVWGRLLYNPEADPDAWRRFLRKEVGPAAAEAEAALANASRILPLVTTAHLPSASNNAYWPEIYTNMPIVDEQRSQPYSDTPTPRRFDTVGALDPELFSSIADFADELVSGRASGRYSPLDVARWLEGFAAAAARHLSEAEARGGPVPTPELRRLALDVALQIGLGSFFASKLRAGVAYALYRRAGNLAALDDALSHYRKARAAWTGLAERAKGAYVPDLTFGRTPQLRGDWADRLAAIDADLSDMERERAEAVPEPDARPLPAIPGPPPRVAWRHAPPPSFRRGEPVVLALELEDAPGIAVEVRYRPINHVEAYRTAAMTGGGGRLSATIPGGDTDTPHPLQYYFVLRDSPGRAWICPGFNAELSNQPYFTIRQA